VVAFYSGSPVPFRQTDWPNPIARPYPNDLRTWIQGPSLSLITSAGFGLNRTNA
jgi:hypothetical protein